MSEAISKRCNNRSAIAYLALAVILSAGFGYSIGVRESVSAVVALNAQQAEERVSIRRHYAAQINADRKRYEALEADYKALAQSRAVQ